MEDVNQDGDKINTHVKLWPMSQGQQGLLFSVFTQNMQNLHYNVARRQASAVHAIRTFSYVDVQTPLLLLNTV